MNTIHPDTIGGDESKKLLVLRQSVFDKYSMYLKYGKGITIAIAYRWNQIVRPFLILS